MTAAVANVNDAPTGSVTISGTPTEDQTLTASNTLADADGLGTITYHWLRGGVDTGATGSTYLLGDADVGAQISVRANYTDGHGTAEAVTSAVTAAVANVNDAPTGSVTISGTPTEDQTLTASNTLADADGLGTITYHWLRGGVDTGATGSTYLLGDADVGAQISVRANYTDGHGTAEAVTSAGDGGGRQRQRRPDRIGDDLCFARRRKRTSGADGARTHAGGCRWPWHHHLSLAAWRCGCRTPPVPTYLLGDADVRPRSACGANCLPGRPWHCWKPSPVR